jgi:hypothetical protein
MLAVNIQNVKRELQQGPKITHHHPHDTPQRNKHHQPSSYGPDKTFRELHRGKVEKKKMIT